MRINEVILKIKQDSFWQVATIACFALGIAYLSELIANLRPCILCIYQRIPYFLLLVMAFAAILRPSLRKSFRFLIVFTFIIEIILASYHTGIEHYIFDDHHICQTNNQIGNMLSSTILVSSCSQVAFKFMNFSMAEWNLFYAIASLSYFIYRERKNGFFTW